MKKVYSTLVFSALSVCAFSQHMGNVIVPKFRGTIQRAEGPVARVATDTLGSGNTPTALSTPPIFAPSGNVYTMGYVGGGYVFGNNVETAVEFKEIAQGYQFAGSAVVEGVAFLLCGKFHGPGHTATTAFNIRAYNFTPTGGTFINPGPPVTYTDVPGPTTVAASASYLMDDADTTFLEFNVVNFASAPSFNGEFAVGAEFGALNAVGDSLGFFCDAPGDANFLDYAFHKVGTTWYVSNTAFGDYGDLDVNIAIFPIIKDVTGINGEPAFFKGMKMSQNYPNPVSTTTSLNYELEKSTNKVTMKVLDLTGKVISQDELGAKGAGAHVYNFDANKIQSGTYLFMLTTDMGTLTQKFTVEK